MRAVTIAAPQALAWALSPALALTLGLTLALGLELALLRPAGAEVLVLAPEAVTEWKAVYARVEARDTVAARARLGGTLAEISVAEGDSVAAGQPIARIVDEKIGYQLGAIDAQLRALDSQLGNAETELRRGEELLARGVATSQALDSLRTQVEVLTGQIAAQQAQRRVVEQQEAEGTVLAPVAGRVLEVPVTRGSVVMAGESVASIGGGGFFLRLAVPERHAAALREGDAIAIETGGLDTGSLDTGSLDTGALDAGAGTAEGRLAKIYPLIQNGRVIADVELPGLQADFVDARVLVRLPVGRRMALLVPAAAVARRSGLDFVTVESAAGPVERAVVLGARQGEGAAARVEVVTGLSAGDRVVTGDE